MTPGLVWFGSEPFHTLILSECPRCGRNSSAEYAPSGERIGDAVYRCACPTRAALPRTIDPRPDHPSMIAPRSP